MKVLIVEDDAISRKMIEMIMKPLVKEYSLAMDGEVALELFNKSVESENNYDLVLLDIMLPKMDGQTLLQKFRKKEKEYNLL
ncbi:MAG: response regulator, partial [Spirochaetales bacterium]|nr:response regulator [Spirochaetales bacterium]